MHALDHGAVLRRHQAGRLGAGDAERVDGLLGGEPQAARRARSRREDADGRARMPALPDMLLAHALADARTDLVAGDSGRQEVAAGKLGMAFGHRNQGRQRDGADMQNALAMDVVEFEALNLRPVDQRRMGRRQALAGPPDRGRAGGVERRAGLAQDAAPFEIDAVDRAADRIENQQLDALADLRRNPLVAQRGDELRDLARVVIVHTGMLPHQVTFPSLNDPRGPCVQSTRRAPRSRSSRWCRRAPPASSCRAASHAHGRSGAGSHRNARSRAPRCGTPIPER